MKLNLACKRFQKLWYDQDARSLSRHEERFLSQHRQHCPDCRAFEQSSQDALSVLRLAALEPEVSPAFEERILRKVRVQTVRDSLGYWSPALVGAGIACVAIFAALQIAATPAQLKSATLPSGEAKRDIRRELPLPNLILDEKPKLDQ